MSNPAYRKVYGKNTAPVGQVDCKYKVTSINLFSFKCEISKTIFNYLTFCNITWLKDIFHFSTNFFVIILS